MVKGLFDGKIGVMESDVFANKGDFDGLASVVDAVEEVMPMIEVDWLGLKVKLTANDLRESLILKHDWSFVEGFDGRALEDAVWFEVAE
jgi:hypothetical protein